MVTWKLNFKLKKKIYINKITILKKNTECRR